MAAQSIVLKQNPSQLIRVAQQRRPGVHTFYISSTWAVGVEYTLQLIRRNGLRRWQCSCPHFYFRCASRRRHCKHLRLLTAMARLARGVSRLAALGGAA